MACHPCLGSSAGEMIFQAEATYTYLHNISAFSSGRSNREICLSILLCVRNLVLGAALGIKVTPPTKQTLILMVNVPEHFF